MWDQATILDKGFVNGYAWVAVRYGNTATGESFDEPIQSKDAPLGWPEPDIHRRLDQLNAMALDAVKVGPVGPKPAPTPTPPQTQDQLDFQNFEDHFTDWQEKDAALGVSKTVTQADVDAAYAAWKALYKEEYAPFLVGKV